MTDHIHEECGVFGVYAPENANNKTGYFWCSKTMKQTYSSSSSRPLEGQ